MSEKALDPAQMLEFTGDLGELERSITALSGDASAIWEAGTQIDTSFRGLSSYYDAPEADRLFATTAPVAAAANDFQSELDTIAQALGAYAAEVRPLVAKLDRLREEAVAFRTRIAGDDEWHYDDELTGENARRRAEMHATWEALQNAERTCANKIFALFSDFRLVPNDGKGDRPDKNEYGYSADMLNNAQGLPWGDNVEESIHWYELHRQIKHFVWDGFIVDGVWGTLRGIGTLFGVDGGAAAGAAWTNLAKVVTGIAITISPAGALLPAGVGGDKTRRWLVDSQNALKEAGKAMVSYDQWGKDNARAAGGAIFNVGTTVLTGGAGAAAKGGGIARAISAASKAAHFVDPATYLAKGVGFGAVKIGDAMATLRNLNSGTYLELASGSYKLSDGPVRAADLPEGSVLRPENSVKGVDANGNTIYLNTETGLIHRADGSVMEKPENVAAEASAQERGAERQVATQPERELAGVGGRGGAASSASEGVGSGSAAGRDVPAGQGRGGPAHPAASGGSGADDLGRSGDEAPSGTDKSHGEAERSSDGGADETDAAGKDGNPYAGQEPDHSRPALPSGDGPLSLREVRNARDTRGRWEMGEELHRQWHGGGQERHYPVPTNRDPRYPVTATGGRKVDVPVDMPDGRTLAVEVKTYGPYRSLTLKDGTKTVIKNEVPLSKHIKEQIHKDLALRRMNPDYDPRWSFTHAGPSDELRAYLKKARIIFLEYGPAPKKDRWDVPPKR